MYEFNLIYLLKKGKINYIYNKNHIIISDKPLIIIIYLNNKS